MDKDYIVRSLRNVEQYFQAYPEDQAVAGITEHIKQFWEPRMVQDLAALIKTSPDVLPPLAQKAAMAVYQDLQES